MANKGHPAEPAILRMMRVVLRLTGAGSHGVRSDVLEEEFGYQSVDAIRRDLRKLEALGWVLETLPDPEGGKRACYRIRPADTRLAAEFEEEERAQLHRVMLLMQRPRLREHLPAQVPARSARGLARLATGMQYRATTPAEGLEILNAALGDRRLVRFVYSGYARAVHPVRLVSKPTGYFLIGLEDGTTRAKDFALARMSELRADRPGTAQSFGSREYRTKDAIQWPIHEPEDFWLELDPDYHPDATMLLGEPTGADGDRLTFTVTNRKAARARVFELLDKVRAVGPDGFRDYLIDDITATVGAERMVANDG